MSYRDRFIRTFSLLGQFLGQFQGETQSRDHLLSQVNRQHFDGFAETIRQEHHHNPWFTEAFVIRALAGISRMLEAEHLTRWLDGYTFPDPEKDSPREIGVVMAGNIPLVGFHDMMCVLAGGHRLLARTSGKDDRLPRKVAAVLCDLDAEMGERIRFTREQVRGVDAMIATGSNNTARYFAYYFRNLPHIIRKNRNGVAVLTGEESDAELLGLGSDIFTYFGMGCRNVTKLYVPSSYDLTRLLGVLDTFADFRMHHKYGNNVDYQRSVYLMNRVHFLDNGAVLLKEDHSIASPVGVVFYERYSEIEWVQQQLKEREEEIQCCVSVHPDIGGAVSPGSSQDPMPWDYADGVDTLQFLTDLK